MPRLKVSKPVKGKKKVGKGVEAAPSHSPESKPLNRKFGRARQSRRKVAKSSDEVSEQHTSDKGVGLSKKGASKTLDTKAGVELSEFVCQHCGKTLNSRQSLRRHERTHSGEKPACCQLCGKRFANNSALRSHGRTHTGERPFSCSTCQQSFAQKATLRDHEKLHRGERPFMCSTCGKSFTKSHGLTRHELIHSGVRPFKCSYCSKAFTQSNALVEHERLHTGQRPFVCSQCPWDFAQSSQLRSHMKIHRNEAHDAKKRKRKESSAYLMISQIGVSLLAGRESADSVKDSTAGQVQPDVREAVASQSQSSKMPLKLDANAVKTTGFPLGGQVSQTPQKALVPNKRKLCSPQKALPVSHETRNAVAVSREQVDRLSHVATPHFERMSKEENTDSAEHVILVSVEDIKQE